MRFRSSLDAFKDGRRTEEDNDEEGEEDNDEEGEEDKEEEKEEATALGKDKLVVSFSFFEDFLPVLLDRIFLFLLLVNFSLSPNSQITVFKCKTI